MSSPVSNISLRMWHPTFAANEIISEMKLHAKFSNSVGEQRRTPTGTPLEGVYKETYCSFSLKNKTSNHLNKELLAECDHLDQHAGFLRSFLHTGGRLEFYISIFLDGDRGFEINPSLIRRMTALELGFTVEMYRLSDQEARYAT